MRHVPRKDGVSPGLAALQCLLMGSIEVASCGRHGADTSVMSSQVTAAIRELASVGGWLVLVILSALLLAPSVSPAFAWRAQRYG